MAEDTNPGSAGTDTLASGKTARRTVYSSIVFFFKILALQVGISCAMTYQLFGSIWGASCLICRDPHILVLDDQQVSLPKKTTYNGCFVGVDLVAFGAHDLTNRVVERQLCC